jgi:hypothetical protein
MTGQIGGTGKIRGESGIIDNRGNHQQPDLVWIATEPASLTELAQRCAHAVRICLS